MAEKGKSLTVIKKITISGGGHHGGAWKVAFADFMTAMMAFFLCMWLLSISPEARQSISDYFSTPSVIEYQFRNFGVELTLEKLFADLLNEPLDTVANLLEPMDKSPNIFEFRDDRIALSYLAEAVGKVAEQIEVNHNEINFVIPDNQLFLPGSSEVTSGFINIMGQVKKVVSGLEGAQIHLTSELYLEGVPDSDPTLASTLATARLDLIQMKVKSSLEHENTEIQGNIDVKSRGSRTAESPVTGYIRFRILRTKEDAKAAPVEEKKQPTKESNFDRPAQRRDLYDELNESFRKEVRKK
jgi:chemotaxis protein MotB